MAIVVRCACGRVLKARDEFGGARAICPTCGRTAPLPLASPGTDTVVDLMPDAAEPTPVTEFLDAPGGEGPNTTDEVKRQAMAGAEGGASSNGAVPVLRRMFEALLDPRSIHWMLVIGGGLCVLGIVVWLVSKGVFADKRVMAAALGAGTLAMLGAGWLVALKTRYRLAGQALTFLGCVVAPLNLWFYHAQGMLTVDGHLWVGGVVCCLIYAATVSVLRDPLFMFACEAGVTLTAVLLLGDLGKITDATWLSLFLMALGLISIHAERAFSPAEASAFPRRRYGLPLFWSGQVQLGAALVILLGSQLMAWFVEPVQNLLGIRWLGNPFAQHHLLAAGMWLAAVYAYLYSDIVVRRVGAYLALAAASLVMAEATLLLGYEVDAEWIIAAMALTAVGVNWAQVRWTGAYTNLDRVAAPLALVLSAIPVTWGVVLDTRATSPGLSNDGAIHETGASFVAVMLVVAIANRVSAYLTRRSAMRASWGYFFLSAVALLTAATGVLRQFELTAWIQQAPWMMLIPLGYMLASRAQRGHTAERPLYWIAQASTAVILLHMLGSLGGSPLSLVPVEGAWDSLMLGMVFTEAAAFYILGATFHRRSANVHFAAAALCGALWQFLGYFGVDPSYYTMLYAGLGFACLAGARLAGLAPTAVYRLGDGNATVLRGRGLAAFQCGSGILCIALLAALMQGLSSLATPPQAGAWFDMGSLAATIAAAGLAAVIAPADNWRRFYAVAAASLTGVLALRANMMLNLHTWEKIELLCTASGVLMLVASHLARFRETEGRREDAVSAGLAMGSVLAVAPAVIATLHHRWVGGAPSLWNEMLLLTVTIAMSVTGVAWQIKWTTLWGGAALVLYLIVLVCSLAYTPQVEIGVYLAAGGAAVFAAGIALSVYRERLLELPERVANREGVFRILNWR